MRYVTVVVEAHDIKTPLNSAPFAVRAAAFSEAPNSASASPNCAAAASRSIEARSSVPPALVPSVPESVAVVQTAVQAQVVVRSAITALRNVLAGSVAMVRSQVVAAATQLVESTVTL